MVKCKISVADPGNTVLHTSSLESPAASASRFRLLGARGLIGLGKVELGMAKLAGLPLDFFVGGQSDCCFCIGITGAEVMAGVKIVGCAALLVVKTLESATVFAA